MVTLTWWILKRNCESCKRAASVLQKGCLWSCKRAITLTLPHCALEEGSSCLRKWHHKQHRHEESQKIHHVEIYSFQRKTIDFNSYVESGDDNLFLLDIS